MKVHASNYLYTNTNGACSERRICLPLTPGLQYRHLLPAPIDRASASAWLYKQPWITFQKISQTHRWSTYVGLLIKAYFYLWGHPRIHAQETSWQQGMRSCIMPGLPRPLVHELKVDTVLLLIGTFWCKTYLNAMPSLKLKYLQTTLALFTLQFESQTVPHCPL